MASPQTQQPASVHIDPIDDEFKAGGRSASKVLTSAQQQTIASAAIVRVQPLMKVAAKNDVERNFYADKKNQEVLAKSLTQPDGAKQLEKYLVSQGINFPERDRILAFFSTVVPAAYAIETGLENNVRNAHGDAGLLSKAMKQYEKEVNVLNRKYGQPPISQVEVQKRVNNILVESGMDQTKALELVTEAARLAGFTSFLSSKGTAPSSAAMAVERQLMQSALLALTYDLYQLAEETARKAEDERRRPKQGEPTAARAEKPEAEQAKLGEKDMRVLNDLADFMNKNIAAGAVAKEAEPLVAQPRTQKETLDVPKEFGTPPASGGATALKVPKAAKGQKAPKPKVEPAKEERKEQKPSAIAAIKVEVPEKAAANKANADIQALEMQYASPSTVVPGKFEFEKKRAIRTGNTDKLKEYVKTLADAIAKRIADQSKKPGMA